MAKTRYYYPKQSSYINLRRDLRRGRSQSTLCVLREFYCACEQHKNVRWRMLSTLRQSTLAVKSCTFKGKFKTGVIDSKGRLQFDYFKFYSRHPEWRVRVAVIQGLSKSRDKRRFMLLKRFAHDKHFGVVLATIQQLENTKRYDAYRTLIELSGDASLSPRIKALARRAKERIDWHQAVANRLLSGIARVKGQSQRLALMKYRERITRLYTMTPNPKTSAMQFKPLHQQNRYCIPSTHAITFSSKHCRWQVAFNRATKRVVRQRKLHFMAHLLLAVIGKQPLSPANKVWYRGDPQVGDIYWSVADKNDPKTVRPVLLVHKIAASMLWIVVPLTTTHNAPSEHFTTIQYKRQTSYLYFNRQVHLPQSLLLRRSYQLTAECLAKLLPELKQASQECVLQQRRTLLLQHRSHRRARRVPLCPKIYELGRNELQVAAPYTKQLDFAHHASRFNWSGRSLFDLLIASLVRNNQFILADRLKHSVAYSVETATSMMRLWLACGRTVAMLPSVSSEDHLQRIGYLLLAQLPSEVYRYIVRSVAVVQSIIDGGMPVAVLYFAQSGINNSYPLILQYLVYLKRLWLDYDLPNWRIPYSIYQHHAVRLESAHYNDQIACVYLSELICELLNQGYNPKILNICLAFFKKQNKLSQQPITDRDKALFSQLAELVKAHNLSLAKLPDINNKAGLIAYQQALAVSKENKQAGKRSRRRQKKSSVLANSWRSNKVKPKALQRSSSSANRISSTSAFMQ